MSFQYMIWTLAIAFPSHGLANSAMDNRIGLNVPDVGEELDQSVDHRRVVGLHDPERFFRRRADDFVARDGLVFARVRTAPFPLDVGLTVGSDLFEGGARFGVTDDDKDHSRLPAGSQGQAAKPLQNPPMMLSS